MSQNHSVTKGKRRPKSKDRVDYTATTMACLCLHEKAEEALAFTGFDDVPIYVEFDFAEVEARVLGWLSEAKC